MEKEFKEYARNNSSYGSYIQKNWDDLVKKITEITEKNLFEETDLDEAFKIINAMQNNQEWRDYSRKNGNGIPNAIVNTHYRNFLRNGFENKEEMFINFVVDEILPTPVRRLINKNQTLLFNEYVELLLLENKSNSHQELYELMKKLIAIDEVIFNWLQSARTKEMLNAMLGESFLGKDGINPAIDAFIKMATILIYEE